MSAKGMPKNCPQCNFELKGEYVETLVNSKYGTGDIREVKWFKCPKCNNKIAGIK